MTARGLGGIEHQIKSSEWSAPAEFMFRMGFIAIGVVYSIIGVLAIMLAVGEGGKLSDTRGALSMIHQAPFGKYLLLTMGLALLGHVAWRFSQAFLNIEDKPHDRKSILARAGSAVSGLAYLSLSFAALRAFSVQSIEQKNEKALTAKVLAYDGGSYAIGAIGLIIIGVGVFQIYKGLSERFLDDFKAKRLDPHDLKAIRISGKIGYPARGLTFGIIGYFLCKAAYQADPSEAKGTAGALGSLLSQPYGPYLLGLVAVGFVIFAIHCFMTAKAKIFVS